MEEKTVEKLNALPGWLSLHEGQFLRKAALMVKGAPGAIVEIGSFQGKSTIWLAGSGERVYAVDPHKGEVDDKKMPPTLKAFRDHLQEFGVAQQVVLMRMTSMEAVASWDKQIKLLFIDGLHDEANAGRDFARWSAYVGDGGIIAMHDAFCGWKGAEKVALRNIVGNNGFREIGVVGSIVYGIRGRSSIITRLLRCRSRLFIRASLYANSLPLPPFIAFMIIHRFFKLLLINRFTLRRR